MLNFKKIELEDLEIYNKFIKDSTDISCEGNFINLLIWQCTYNNMIAVKDGMLFIKVGTKKESFLLPLGNDLKKGIEEICNYCGNSKPVFYTPEGDKFDEFKRLYSDKCKFTELRNNFDYIYNRNNLAELQGKKYHSKRNHINRFTEKFDWHYETLNENNINDVRICAEKWYQENTEKLDKSMLCEKKGVETILNNFTKLNAKGGIIYADNIAVAFTLGSEISSLSFDIHIEKALNDYSEAYTVINREFVKNELNNYKYINREDDMGLEGLRRAKLSYNPEILLKKYLIEWK